MWAPQNLTSWRYPGPQERRTLTRILFAAVAFVLAASSASAQTQPTQAEKEQWANPDSYVLESSPCKKITWLLESERNRPRNDQVIHDALG
jgi:hypothetical protein